MNRNYGQRSQSSLGTEFKRRYKDSSNITRFSLGRVMSVNYQYNTVDVFTKEGNFGTTVGGKFSAKLPVRFSGQTSNGNVFGEINPIEVGSLVLVGFVDGNKSTPIVINVYGREAETRDLTRIPLNTTDPRDTKLKQLSQFQYTVFPGLTYKGIDGKGNVVNTFTGKSFFATEAGPTEELGGITDWGVGTKYEELPTSYYGSGKLIEPEEGKAPTMLFRHQAGGCTEGDNHVFMVFLGGDGTYRTTIQQEGEDWKSEMSLSPKGDLKLSFKGSGEGSDDYKVQVGAGGISLESTRGYTRIGPEVTEGDLATSDELLEEVRRLRTEVDALMEIANSEGNSNGEEEG